MFLIEIVARQRLQHFYLADFMKMVSSMNIFLEKFRHSRNSQFFLHNMHNITFLTYYHLSVTAKSPSAKSSTQVIMC